MNQEITKAKPRHVPGATYRLQFNREFNLQQAQRILPYLQELGVTDLYASPLFQAGPESTHGYDVCCFGTLNPALGTEEDFTNFTRARQDAQLGLLLDMVPNHMGAALSNAWWLDVLEHGEQSRYAPFFDIDWNPSNPSLRGKVLLPMLGDHYGKVLERGELKLTYKEDRFTIAYFEHQLPVNPRTIPQNLKEAARLNRSDLELLLEEFNGRADNPNSFDLLHLLLDQQAYRLAFWRVGSEEINYRRFFDVTQLVGLRMDRMQVFEASHAVAFQWLKEGKVTSLRIDHPDGLRNPREYFERLQQRAHQEDLGGDLYVVAEKILSGDERLRNDWRVAGTTGYDYLNRLSGIFVDPRGEAAMNRIYDSFRGRETNEESEGEFHKLVASSKKQILEISLASEWEALSARLRSIASGTRAGRDFTLKQCRTVLKEVIAAFPVYRTYVTENDETLSTQDSAVITQAFKHARAEAEDIDPGLFDFLEGLLTLRFPADANDQVRNAAREFVARFQQLSGPVMAKGLEDTAFYNFNRLISLNEVGGEPARFGCSVEAFHGANQIANEHWPHTLLATATHDTKRGEDARARINVLSELCDEWEQTVTRWREWNRAHKRQVDGRPAPDPNDEYMLYQSLVGAVPDDLDERAHTSFVTRAKAFAQKAFREAKSNTTWTAPNEAYENAVNDFLDAILMRSATNPFLADLERFVRRVAFFGRLNSLGQTVLKLASPGVPDIYQGTELWDYSFVDPDNRRPVDFNQRQQLLKTLKRKSSDNEQRKFTPELDASGIAKLFVIWKALALRNGSRNVFEEGDYEALRANGEHALHVCAFAKRHEQKSIIAIVPRLVAGLTKGEERLPLGIESWGSTELQLPVSLSRHYHNVFTGEVLSANAGKIRLGEVFTRFPVALLESREVLQP